MKVFNKEGDSLSTNVAFILASVPQKPLKPSFVSDGWEVLITMYQPLDGGSVIVNYELQIDFEDDNGFTSVVGQPNFETLDL